MTDEQFSELKGLVEQNTAKTDAIHKAIAGDPELGSVGLAERLEKTEKTVASHESYKTKLLAWASGVAAATGGGMAGVISWFRSGSPPGN